MNEWVLVRKPNFSFSGYADVAVTQMRLLCTLVAMTSFLHLWSVSMTSHPKRCLQEWMLAKVVPCARFPDMCGKHFCRNTGRVYFWTEIWTDRNHIVIFKVALRALLMCVEIRSALNCLSLWAVSLAGEKGFSHLEVIHQQQATHQWNGQKNFTHITQKTTDTLTPIIILRSPKTCIIIPLGPILS